MGVDILLSHLEKVRPSGAGHWMARCPAHNDRNPSLSIGEGGNGTLLVKCFAGCTTRDVLAAIGLEEKHLFPNRQANHNSPTHRPIPTADALRSIAFEALVVATSGATLLAGEPFSQHDRERLMLAVARIQAAIDAAGIRYG